MSKRQIDRVIQIEKERETDQERKGERQRDSERERERKKDSERETLTIMLYHPPLTHPS